MQIISKVVQELGVEEKLICRPLEFFRYERKNRGDGLSGCATSCQSGRSMIEMLGVLAIIGVLSVGGIVGYSKAMLRYKINKTIEYVTYAANNIRTLFASQGNYYGASDEEVWKKAHIFPDDAWKDGWPQSVWGDRDISVGTDTKNAADANYNKAFNIYDDGDAPVEACIELLTYDWKNAQVKAIGIFSSENSVLSYNVNYIIPPAKIDDAVKLCDQGGTTDYDYSFSYHFDIDTSDSLWKDLIDATTARLAGN